MTNKLRQPECNLSVALQVEALCLVNCVSTQAGWIEWGYQKLNARHLRSKGMTQGVLDYLMWHHFGKVRLRLLGRVIFWSEATLYTLLC